MTTLSWAIIAVTILAAILGLAGLITPGKH